MRYEYSAWPGKNLGVVVDKVEAETGRIVKTKITNYRLTKSQWKKKGFSFTGKIYATCS